MYRIKRLVGMLASVAVIGIWSAVNAQPAFATANTTCNLSQGAGDNTWVVRNQPSSSAVTGAGATISYFDYNLCRAPIPGPLGWPNQSSSGAWVGIVNGGGSIIQVGYIKCNPNQVLGCKNVPAQDDGITIAFWAWGNDGDIFKQPWPHFLANVTNANHTFSVYKVNRSTCYYSMSMDVGASDFAYSTVPCSTINWTPTAAQIGNEVWNSGDQLGGYSGTPQRFSSENYTNANGKASLDVHNGPYQSGHCYPQVGFSNSSGQGDDWRSWTYVADHQAC